MFYNIKNWLIKVIYLNNKKINKEINKYMAEIDQIDVSKFKKMLSEQDENK